MSVTVRGTRINSYHELWLSQSMRRLPVNLLIFFTQCAFAPGLEWAIFVLGESLVMDTGYAPSVDFDGKKLCLRTYQKTMPPQSRCFEIITTVSKHHVPNRSYKEKIKKT